MSDKLTIEQRHYNMSRIRAKDTKPEIIVRKWLWSHGYRYRLNHPRLPGKPDIVLRKYRTCIFVNGCFWHGHRLAALEVNSEKLKVESASMLVVPEIQNSECCKIPKTNREFWVRKITRNKERDIEVQKKVAEMGWHSITIWECELKSSRREATLASLEYTLNRIYLQDHQVHRYVVPEEEESMMKVAEDTEVVYGKKK